MSTRWQTRGGLRIAAVLGFLGSLMVALGAACRTARVPHAAYYAWLERAGLDALATDSAGRVLVTAGCALWLVAWLMCNPTRCPGRVPGWVLAAWAAPMTLTLPVLSTDAYAYLDLGWQLTAGHDPYVAGLGTAGGPFGELIVAWRGTQSPYPPGSLLLMEQAVLLGGFALYPSLLMLRVPTIVGLAVLWWVLPRLAERVGASARWARWLVALNPLVIVHGVGGVHYDIVAVAVGVLALYVAVTRRAFVAAAALVGVAMLIKQTAGVALVPIALYAVTSRAADRRDWGRALLVVATAGAVFVAGSVVTLGLGWVGPLGRSSMASSMAPTNVLWSTLRLVFDLDAESALVVGVVRRVLTTAALVGAVAFVITRLRGSALREPLVIGGWLAFAVVVAGPSLREWYWMVPLAMLALVRDTRAYAACIVTSGYAVLSLPFAEYGFGAVALHEKVLLATAIGAVLTGLWLSTAGRWGLRLRRARRVRAASISAPA